MPYFENPAHREALIQLGILQADETSLSGQELAERVLQSQAIEAVLSILRQEVAQPLTNYGMIDSIISMTKAAANLIRDESTLVEAIRQLRQLAAIPLQAETMARDLIEFVDIVDKRLSLKDQPQLSMTGLNEVRRIRNLSGDLLNQVDSYEATVSLAIGETNEIISQRRKEVGL